MVGEDKSYIIVHMSEVLFPSETFLRTAHFDAHQDHEIPIAGFLIIASIDASKRSVADFSADEAEELARLIRDVRIAMKTVLGIEDVYLFQREDTEHGFHVWIFPRLFWMERFGRKIESVRPIMDFARREMNTEEVRNDVRLAIQKMRAYFKGRT